MKTPDLDAAHLDAIRTGMAAAGDCRFHAVAAGLAEYEIRDYATPANGRPYTRCCGFHGNDPEWVERAAWAAARRLNSGQDQPDPIWYQ